MNYIFNFHLNSNSKFIQQNLELAIKHSLKNLISNSLKEKITNMIGNQNTIFFSKNCF